MGEQIALSEGKSSLADQTYQQISEKIIRGDYKAGHRLREREISEDLSISRIPIREALPQLEADGFIDIFPRRGAVVRAFTLKDVEELFDVRLNLEVFAARKAAEQMASGGSAERLEILMVAAEAAKSSDDFQAISTFNAQIHAEIITLSGNKLLVKTMRPVLGKLRWLFALTSQRDPQIQYGEHRALYEAIQAGKPELAAAIAYAHIEMGREPSLAQLAGVLPAE